MDMTKADQAAPNGEWIARQFDLELREGDSVLLTGPEFKSQYLLLTPYIVE